MGSFSGDRQPSAAPLYPHRVYFHARRAAIGDWSVVHVVGEVDLATAPKFRSELVSAGRDGDFLAIDLTECSFIDSVGIGLLVGANRRSRESGGTLTVVASGPVRQLLDRCGVGGVFAVVESIEELPAVSVTPGTRSEP